MKDIISASGEYRVEGFDRAGNKVSDQVFHNVLTQGFFTAIFQLLNQAISAPAVDSLNLTHTATGNGTTPCLKADTAMESEQFRKQISSKSYSATKFTCKTSLDTTESNFTITELGTFAKATDSPGTGTLISHAIVNIEKNANIKYLITYTITIQ